MVILPLVSRLQKNQAAPARHLTNLHLVSPLASQRVSKAATAIRLVVEKPPSPMPQAKNHSGLTIARHPAARRRKGLRRRPMARW